MNGTGWPESKWKKPKGVPVKKADLLGPLGWLLRKIAKRKAMPEPGQKEKK